MAHIVHHPTLMQHPHHVKHLQAPQAPLTLTHCSLLPHSRVSLLLRPCAAGPQTASPPSTRTSRCCTTQARWVRGRVRGSSSSSSSSQLHAQLLLAVTSTCVLRDLQHVIWMQG
jgi:hypothetical protein